MFNKINGKHLISTVKKKKKKKKKNIDVQVLYRQPFMPAYQTSSKGKQLKRSSIK